MTGRPRTTRQECRTGQPRTTRRPDTSARRLAAAHAIWRSRRRRSTGDTAFTLYALGLVLLIVVAPVIVSLWMWLTGPAGGALLLSARVPETASTVTAVLWVSALLLGRRRGPALLPSFLLHAVTASDIRRSLALRRPVIQWAAVLMTICAGAAALAAGVLTAVGQSQAADVLVFGVTGAAAGLVAVILWLVGQAHPRVTGPVAMLLLALAALGLVLPALGAALGPVLPWGWMGLLYPGTASGTVSGLVSGQDVLPLVGLVVLAGAGVAAAPVLLSRIPSARLQEQAARWERAVAGASALDLRVSRAAYTTGPGRGGTLRAVRPGRRLWVTIVVSDAIAQVRTPGRLLGALGAATVAGVLLATSFPAGVPTVLAAGAAGTVIHVASGSLSAGLRYAADVAGDYPLFGISDRRLVSLHAIFPLVVLLLALVPSSVVAALIGGAAPGPAVVGTGALAVLAVALQVAGALKGPFPPALLTPVNTPAGDVSVVLQIMWAGGELALVILGTMSLVAASVTPWPFLVILACTGSLLLTRWAHRR